jgi:hypothetical protein
MFVYAGPTAGRRLRPLGGELRPAIAFMPVKWLQHLPVAPESSYCDARPGRRPRAHLNGTDPVT